VVVRVRDAAGLSDTRSYTISVQNVNDPPAISSSPPADGVVGAPYHYAATAQDPDANELFTWSLDAAPPGMTVDAQTGVVSWSPAPGQLGPQSATLRVSDAGGLFATQALSIDVAADTTPPVVAVSATPQRFLPGGLSELAVSASDEAPIVARTLTVDGVPLALDAAGRATFTSSDPGVHEVVATATDVSGNVGTATTLVGVADLADSEPPAVAIESPAELEVVTFLHTVLGTVADDNLLSWRLSLARLDDDGAPRLLAAGSAPVASAALGSLDTTLLQNGLYRLHLVAEDVNGATGETQHAVRIDGGAKIGPVRLSFVDLVVPVVGIPIQVVRSYDSRDTTPGEFGHGWRLELAAGSMQHNREVGDGWQIVRPPGAFSLPCTSTSELEAHRTEIRLSDREFYVFRPALANLFQVAGGCRGEVFYELVDGTTLGATLDIVGDREFIHPNGSGVLLDVDTWRPFQPTEARLTTADGRSFDLDVTRGITALEDANGNYLVIQANGIASSDGKSIVFERDGAGRITRVADPLGNDLHYVYDAAGDLAAVTNQVEETTGFEYSPEHPHHLVRIREPDGDVIAAFDYDADGRIVGACDAEAHCSEVDHDLAGRRETQTDPTGVSVVYTYDERGNVTSRRDELGNTTYFEYDERDHLTRLEDATGAVTTFAYDASGNLLERVDPYQAGDDPADFTTGFTYDAGNRLTSVTLPTGATVHRDYDASGNETAIRDDLGNTILGLGYGPGGVVTSEVDRFGATTHQYDGDPEPSSSTDPFGRVATMDYDALGNLVAMNDETGAASFSYDALGRPTFSDYGNGVTSLEEHTTGAPDWTATSGPTLGRIERRFTPTGRIAGWVAPDGAEVSFHYDAAGRLVEEVDALGNATRTTYDAAGRPETVTDLATGAVTTTERDAVGRPLRVIDALGHDTEFTYTPGGLLETRTDALDHTWRNVYAPDATTVRDPLGRETRIEHNAYGLPIGEVFADGSSRSAEYAGATLLDESQDFPTRLVDEMGRDRVLAYDLFSQLVLATDLAGEAWIYEHEQDQLKRVVSPEGIVTRELHYDVLGDVERVVYPNGAEWLFAYGADRNLATETRPEGTTLTYTWDAAGRERGRTSSLGESRTAAYGIDGAIDETTDATGTTEYHYDAAGRFTGITYPDGGSVTYAHDLLGRVTAITVKAGPSAAEWTTTYEYDAVGNLVRITDPRSGVTETEYDAAGRPTERRLPNGVVTTFGYDLRDRLLSVVHRNAGGQVLASATYERSLSGEPTRITREDDSYVEIDYDAAWRVAAERHHAADGTLLETVAYGYDRDGNRTSRTSSLAGAESYSYLHGFELDAVSGPGGSHDYATDAGGRTTAITRPGLAATFAWDSDDHPTTVSVAGGPLASYAYDAAGRRTRATLGGTPRHYLVAAPFGDGLESPQLASDGAGNAVAAWVYAGEQPLLRIDPASGEAVYYLEDAMGSVLALADDTGARTARFAYDAFGRERDASGPQAALPSDLGGDFRYHGQWQDAPTGLYHVRARVYDPVTGRFLSRDPVEGAFARPESFHPYTWNANNPHVYRDATGEFSLISISVGNGIQSNLINIGRSYLINSFKDEIRDRVKGVAGDLLLSFLRTLLPADPSAFSTFLDEFGAKKSLAFEGLLLSQLCNGLGIPDVIQDGVRAFARFSSSGKPASNGLGCRDFNANPEFRPGGSDNEIDITFTPIPLTADDGPSVAKRSGRAYLPVELKINAYNFTRSRSQLNVISEFTGKYVGSRSALLVAIKGSAAKHRLERVLRDEMLENGVLMFLLTLLD
jgi:RHS repeat-associated protein